MHYMKKENLAVSPFPTILSIYSDTIPLIFPKEVVWMKQFLRMCSFVLNTCSYILLLHTLYKINLFPSNILLRSSKLKEFIDDNLNFDENGRKFSKRVENTMRKREIARFVTSNFSFSHRVFKRLVLQIRKKQRLVWERVYIC